MAIPKGHKTNYETLLKAAQSNDLALMECTDTKTGDPVYVLCAVNRLNKEFEFVPLARLFNSDPYEEVNPPVP